MIKTTLVAMTLLGCDCDAKVCEYVGEMPARWSSVAECEAAMTAHVAKRRDLDYPLVSGLCLTVEGTGTEMTASIPASSQLQVAGKVRAEAFASNEPVAPRPTQSVPLAPQVATQDSDGSRLYAVALGPGRTLYRRSADSYHLMRTGFGKAASGAASLVKWTAASVVPGL